MRHPLYTLACILVPAVWGFIASWAYDRYHARRRRAQPTQEEGVDMYHI